MKIWIHIIRTHLENPGASSCADFSRSEEKTSRFLSITSQSVEQHQANIAVGLETTVSRSEKSVTMVLVLCTLPQRGGNDVASMVAPTRP